MSDSTRLGPSRRTPLRALVAVCTAAALVSLGACAKEGDGGNDKAPKAAAPSQTVASAPEPSVEGVQAPPHAQAPNGASTVNDKVVQH